MALQVSLTIVAPCAPVCPDPDVVYPEAYAKILSIRVTDPLSFPLVAWYADAAAHAEGADPVQLKEYGVETSQLQGDIYPAAYAWLLTLPEFAGAIEVS